MIIDRFYYDRLTQTDKIIYKEIYKTIVTYQKSCTIKMVDTESLNAIIEAILLDNPHLFYVGREYSVTSLYGKRFTLQLTYSYSLEEIRQYQAKINAFVNHIVQKFSRLCDEYLLVKNIHDYLVTNLTYSKTENCDTHNIVGVIINHKSVCDGIAKATKMILNALNVKCIVVNGKDKDAVGHSWNIVKINGLAYHLDITWDLNRTYGNSISYDYFNLCDNDIIKDHIVPNGSPPCTSVDHSYFTITGKKFRNVNSLLSAIRQTAATKAPVFYFKWCGKNSITQVSDMLLNYFRENLIDDYYQIHTTITVNPTQSTLSIAFDKIL